jgi:hypothetical protein
MTSWFLGKINMPTGIQHGLYASLNRTLGALHSLQGHGNQDRECSAVRAMKR